MGRSKAQGDQGFPSAEDSPSQQASCLRASQEAVSEETPGDLDASVGRFHGRVAHRRPSRSCQGANHTKLVKAQK